MAFKFLILISLTCNFCASSQSAPIWPFGSQQLITFPSPDPPTNFSLINVKDFGAKGDGKTDDTISLQNAINNHTAREILYFPSGTYMISAPLLYGNGTSKIVQRIIQGQSVDTTTIKIIDSSPLFQDKNNPKAILTIGYGIEQNFWNNLWCITLNTGKDNSGAIGLRFDANNEGSVRNVSIISQDIKSGTMGIDMTYSHPPDFGPFLFKYIYIYGFQVSINITGSVDSVTLEHIYLDQIQFAGIVNYGQVVMMRNLTTIAGLDTSYSIYQHAHPTDGVINLVDGRFIGHSNAANVSVYNYYGIMFLRNIFVENYKYQIVQYTAKATNNPDIFIPNTDNYIYEYHSHSTIKLFENNKNTSLNLTVKETPNYDWGDPSKWKSGLGSNPNCTIKQINGKWTPDCSPLFQAVLNSGAETIYFPKPSSNGKSNGNANEWYFYDDIYIPSTVKHIIGDGVIITGTAKWIIQDGDETTQPLILDRIWGALGNIAFVLNHKSKRDIVLRSCAAIKYDGNCLNESLKDIGNLYLDDVVGINPVSFCKNQKVYARQLNTEDANLDINITQNAQVWIMGYKIEKGFNGLINVTNNGQLELLGTFAYSSANKLHNSSLFNIKENAKATITGFHECNYNSDPFYGLVSEDRDNVTKVLYRNSSVDGLEHGDGGSAWSIYNAWN